MIKEQAKYICDICGEPIKEDLNNLDLVTLSYEVVTGNQWDIRIEKREKHIHKSHLKNVIDLKK